MGFLVSLCRLFALRNREISVLHLVVWSPWFLCTWDKQEKNLLWSGLIILLQDLHSPKWIQILALGFEGNSKYSWDGSIALNSRIRNTREPTLTSAPCLSCSPKLIFYVCVDSTLLQLPQTCHHKSSYTSTQQLQSPLWEWVCGWITLPLLPYTFSCCLDIHGNSEMQPEAEYEDGCTSDPALWSVLIDLFPFCWQCMTQKGLQLLLSDQCQCQICRLRTGRVFLLKSACPKPENRERTALLSREGANLLFRLEQHFNVGGQG